MASKFDSSGHYFLCTEMQSSGTTTELFRLDSQTGAMTAMAALPPQASGAMPLGFDASAKHMLMYRVSAVQNGYSEQVSVFDFNAAQGTVAFNNSSLTTPPHSSDANPLTLSDELLFSRNGTGMVTVYKLDPEKGTLTAPLSSFATNTDFTIPFAVDGLTNTVVSLGMQANKVSAFHLDLSSGALLKSDGPYQAGSAPESMVIAHQ